MKKIFRAKSFGFLSTLLITASLVLLGGDHAQYQNASPFNKEDLLCHISAVSFQCSDAAILPLPQITFEVIGLPQIELLKPEILISIDRSEFINSFLRNIYYVLLNINAP